MALMELLTPNVLNTTTMIVVSSNTSTAQYLFDRNVKVAYTTSGYNSTTAAVISIVFNQPTVLSHILIQNHNLRAFRIYYNSVTANSLHVATTNSATSTYITFNSITVSSVDLQMDNTIAGSVEKSVGELIVAERRLQFERNPTIRDWAPITRRKQIVHEMPDGGVKVFNIRDKFHGRIGWDFITETFHNALLTEHTRALAHYFVPFPTTTAWDTKAWEVMWIGDFNFKHSDNSKDQGYSGEIVLRQTAGG